MIPETYHPQESKSVCPGRPALHAKTDPGRYFTQSPQCLFSRGTAIISIHNQKIDYFSCLSIGELRYV